MPLILTPLLTVVLTPSDYGYLGIATIIVSLLRIVIGFNPSLFLITKYFTLSKDQLSKYYTNIFAVIFLTFLVVMSIFTLTVSVLFARYKLDFLLLLILSLTSAFMVVESLILVQFQMEKKAKSFLKYSLISSGLQLCLILVSVVILKLGWKGKLFADLLSELIIFFVLIQYLIKSNLISREVSKSYLKGFVSFSLPLLPHSTSIWIMNFIDRFILGQFVGISEVGQYTVAYNFGLGLSLLFDALQRVWQPYFYEYIQKEDSIIKAKIVKLTWIYYFLSFVVFGILQLLVVTLFPLIIGKSFEKAMVYLPLIFLGYTFQGMYRGIASYLYYLNKTTLLMTITVSSAIMNIVLDVVLIKQNGTIGAAQATCITYIISFLAVQLAVLKIYDMPWFSFSKILKKSK